MIDDEESIELHKKAIVEELSKAKPQDSVLRPLMKSTYSERRMFVQNEAVSVKEIIEKCPALCHPLVVSNMLWLCA